jgi:hypothetical protein
MVVSNFNVSKCYTIGIVFDKEKYKNINGLIRS